MVSVCNSYSSAAAVTASRTVAAAAAVAAVSADLEGIDLASDSIGAI